jgi:hypothetical protein
VISVISAAEARRAAERVTRRGAVAAAVRLRRAAAALGVSGRC